MATFTFNSNTTVNGTSNADLLLGTDTAGNNNDIVYGHQGDDTIEGFPYGTFALNNSTLYGGQGNDLVYANNHNVVYGNQGNDFLHFSSDTFDGIYANNNTVYGGKGDDTIDFDNAANGNVAYGGAGNNVIYAYAQFKDTFDGGTGNDTVVSYGSTALFVYGSSPGSSIYGNDSIGLWYGTTASTVSGGQGNDSIYSAYGSTGNKIYGLSGNDSIKLVFSSADVLYGNQGNDTLYSFNAFAMTAYGGQGNDTIYGFYGAHSALYGQRGNDVVADEFGTGGVANGGFFIDNGSAQGTSVLYGGAGDDTLIAYAAGGDTMFGGLGFNLFVGNDGLASDEFTANDLITVGDFVTGNDRLSMSTDLDANDVGLAKENDVTANNANDAISFADAFYSSHPGSEYLFIYGGAGAGYLFYNGDFDGTAPNDGMILVGANAESSVSKNDIVESFHADGAI